MFKPEIKDAEAKKAKFAALLMNTPNEPFVAAMGVEPDNNGIALWIATHWIGDDEVLAHQKRLRESGEDLNNLPNKAAQLAEIWKLTQHGLYEDRIKAHKLYADIKGHIEKPQPAVSVNVNNNRVMVIRDQGSDDDWEKKVAKQQSDLLSAASTRH